MHMLKLILIISVIVGLLAIMVHEFSPKSMTWLYSAPVVRTLMFKFHSVVKDVQNGIQDLLNISSLDLSEKVTLDKSNKILKERLLTAEELRRYDGKQGSRGLYLAILGLVFNVKKGKKHYGPGGGYEFFAGCDASRAFVTGEFTEEGLTDDIRGLSATDYVGLDDWLKFYRNDYKYVGKLIGRYYDENGMPTHYQGEAQKWIAEAFQQKDDENLEKKMFPPCNSEWTSSSGSRLWCTKRSGGVDRDWVGVPRKLYSPGQSKPRCACIKTSGPPSYDPQRKIHNDRGDLEYPNLEEYAGCRQDDTECFIVDD